MIRNFFKVAYRNLLRNKAFSAINITGLAIGMAAAMLIFLWIQDEVSYDQFHKNKDRIYESWNRVKFDGSKLSTWNSVPDLFGPILIKDIPEVERAVRVVNDKKSLFVVGDKKIIESGYLVDTGFLQVFSFPMLRGDASTALNDKHSVILTEKTARRLFGNEDPMGKIIKVADRDNFTVAGILKDLPVNTRFEFDYLLSRANLQYGEGQNLGWGDNSTPTYVLLKPNVSFAAVNGKVKELRQKYNDDAKKMKWEMFLYPLSRWRLYSSFTDGVEDNQGRILFVKLFGIIAGFILLIACINFMNLSTARSEKRAKEVGIRKVVGAQKGSLISQFIGESVLLAFLAGVVAIIIVQISLSGYNQLIDKKLFINFGDVYTWMAFVGFILFVGFLAGSYPAFFLSSFQPVKVLKGTFKKANALVTPRKILVVLQFTFAIILIICTFIIQEQIQYGQNRDAGYDRHNLVYTFTQGDATRHY